MKLAYPVTLSAIDGGYLVFVPDLQINTHGADIPDAIEMARDAISVWCVAESDEGRPLPVPSDLQAAEPASGGIATLVDVDIDEYRKRQASFSIRKNLTLPAWLNFRAEAAGVNFSQTLQRALKQELGIAE
ncbi:MAG: type II toxin-antitoxin system HicB family antitoxin [Spirochaetes bacterium]|nr:type II toxin-antitoxin system HicB family antitoxin [Spirochaetota bacterium]